MDKLDIFEMSHKTKVITTIGQLRRVYSIGERDGIERQKHNHDRRIATWIESRPILIEGEII